MIYLRGTREKGSNIPGITFGAANPSRIDKIISNNNVYFKRFLYINEKLPLEYLLTMGMTHIG